MEIVLLLLALFSGGVFVPNGGRHVRGETGSCVDPNGIRCNRGFAGDSGGGMDPNGDRAGAFDPNG